MNIETLKNKAALLALVLLTATCMGCGAVQLTPDEQTTVNHAVKLDLLPIEVRDIKNPCVIVPGKDLAIYGIDHFFGIQFGMPEKNIAFVAPGKHTVSVLLAVADPGPVLPIPIVGGVSAVIGFGGSKHYELAGNAEFNCESGKHYNMIKKGLIKRDIIFTEITDANALLTVNKYIEEHASYVDKEKAATEANARQNAHDREAYLLFSQHKPNLLAGKWRKVGKEEIELEFIDNTIKWAGKKYLLADNARPSVEGQFVFNENTIFLRWDRFDTFPYRLALIGGSCPFCYFSGLFLA